MLKFTDGPLLNEQISISGEQRLVFGSKNEEYVDDPAVKFVSIQGDRIAPSHFEIYYESSTNTLLLHNLNELTEESCGLYKRLFVGE